MKSGLSYNRKNNRKRTFKTVFISLFTLIILSIGLFIGYSLDYYEADEAAQNLLTSTEEVELLNKSPIHFSPTNPTDIGVIFYPGGKVDEIAYTPIMQRLAEAGYETFIADMPFHLAVFDIDAADPIIEENPQIKQWYIGGHSLGAAMGASYAEDNVDKIDGLILLAGYSTADLSNLNLPVLALFGTEDQVIDSEKVDKYRPNLPAHTTEIEIDGGNHAQFGRYGEQDGDGRAKISADEQIEITVESILEFIERNQINE